MFSAGCASDTDAVDQRNIALFDEVNTAIFILNDTPHILAANRAACDMIRRDIRAIKGVALASISPKDGNALLHRYVRRTVAAGERLSVHALVAGGDRWIHFRTNRSGTGVAVTLYDMTEPIAARHSADVKAAMITALDCDGGIGYARISVREMVESASSQLTEPLGISEEAFCRVRFSTVIPTASRIAFGEAVERAFAGKGSQRIEASLLDRDGKQIPVCISIVELRGDCASEGAIVSITQIARQQDG